MLAGILPTEHAGRLRALRGYLVGNFVVSAAFALPLLPLSTTTLTARLNEAVAETVGWPELTRQVSDVVASLPADERAHVVLLTLTYGEAGALDRFGRAVDLPPAYSPHNSYADFRRPDDVHATVVAVRFTRAHLAPQFDRCDQVATVDNGRDVDNEVQGTPILVCRGLRGSWPEVWAQLRHLS